MSIITLTTDWGLKDYHVAALKGSLLSISPSAAIVDITHLVEGNNIAQGAFIFKNAYVSFPNGTIHIVGVGSFTEKISELLLIKRNGHYFIGMNDGFFSLVFEEKPVDMVVLALSENAFAAYDTSTIVKAAEHVINGNNIYELGSRPAEFVEKTIFRPVIEEDVIRGTVVYIDEFGNAITNISRDLFESQRKQRKFEINARRQQYTVSSLNKRYDEAEQGCIIALFNTSDLLEIAINHGNASRLLGLKQNDTIRIDFQ